VILRFTLNLSLFDLSESKDSWEIILGTTRSARTNMNPNISKKSPIHWVYTLINELINYPINLIIAPMKSSFNAKSCILNVSAAA
jgi:hypothetical protein